MSAHHHENDDHHGHENLAPGSASALIKDPVCGMTMDPSTAKHNFSYQGETYYFCSEVCRSKFVADPDSYLNASPNLKERKAPAGTVWTCPMHPEIRRDAPVLARSAAWPSSRSCRQRTKNQVPNCGT